MEAKLYVGNFSYNTTEENLRELFMQAGGVEAVGVVRIAAAGTGVINKSP